MKATLPPLTLALTLACFRTLSLRAEEPATIRIACVGDSITVGNYPSDLEKMLNHDYELKKMHPGKYVVGNFGFSGSTILHCSEKVYLTDPKTPLPQAKEFKPDIVVFMLGTNDSRRSGPTTYKCIDSLEVDFKKLIAEFTALPTKPKLYIAKPVPIYNGGNWGLNNENLVDGVIPRILNVARELRAPVIDMYSALSDLPYVFSSDNVHPGGGGGRTLIAAQAFRVLTGVEPPAALMPGGDAKASYSNYQPTAAPAAPTGLVAKPVFYNQVDLTWADASADEAGFVIEQKTGSEAYQEIERVGANLTKYCAISLKPQTAYSFRVKAINAKGESKFSNEISATTPGVVPLVPRDLKIKTVSPTQLDLAWFDEPGEKDGFHIERKEGEGEWVEIGATPANTRVFSDTKAKAGVVYSYRIRTFNQAGNSKPSFSVVATTTPPKPPTDLTVVLAPPSGVTLKWQDNADTETAYRIEIKSDTGGVVTQNMKANMTGEKISNLSADSTYAFRVVGVNSAGDSAPTAEVKVQTPPGGPKAPGGLKAEQIGAREVRLTWSDQSPDETAFRVERRVGEGNFQDGGKAEANETSIEVKNLDPAKEHRFRVRAENKSGLSRYSEEAMVKTTAEQKKP